jgi:hypothetical protein
MAMRRIAERAGVNTASPFAQGLSLGAPPRQGEQSAVRRPRGRRYDHVEICFLEEMRWAK